MYTPSVWILNVFEILQAKNFCNFITLGCETSWDIESNEGLNKLGDILKVLHEYGSDFLEQPRVNSKVYCAKSLTLVANVKSVFDVLDECSAVDTYKEILNEIDLSSNNLLNKECRKFFLII